MLRAGDAPPLDYAAFLDQCQGAVSDRVYRSLEELTVRSEDGGFVSRWAAFYRVLQGELTYQRRVKRGESCAAPNERDAAVTQTVTAAVNAKNPLEGERLLLALEDLTGMTFRELFGECEGRRYFNPRAPCGARPALVFLVSFGFHFNPRAPCGARPNKSIGILATFDFNPRAPCGARRCGK